MTTMEYEGHKLILEPKEHCDGCFFADKGSCPDCDGESIWVEKGYPWHTGTPTEEGWYLVAFTYNHEEGVRYTTDYIMSDGKWAFPIVNDLAKIEAWMPITPFEANHHSEGEEKRK